MRNYEVVVLSHSEDLGRLHVMTVPPVQEGIDISHEDCQEMWEEVDAAISGCLGEINNSETRSEIKQRVSYVIQRYIATGKLRENQWEDPDR
jgi:GH25 family lysozyme M1 (1,4-beta-N-acetylmuramidase)